MFKELAKHNYLGSIEEFRFLFDNTLYCDQPVAYIDIEHKCRRNPFLFRNGIRPILDFLLIIGFINKNDNETFQINCEEFHLRENPNLVSITINILLEKLLLDNEFNSLFDENTLEFDNTNGIYSIRSYHIKPHLNNIKRLFLDIGFLKIDNSLKTSLLIREEFTTNFEQFLPIRSKRRLPLDKLKELNDLNDKLGKEAELYVLRLEQLRLKEHELFYQITRISEENTSAGYDIESFDSLSSITIDRFVEVKSFSKEIKFYWSRSEVEAAKRLKNKYCLCLVDRDKMHDGTYYPTFISNPYLEIFSSNEIWDKKIERWIIKKK